jgi:hypothetical protein
VIGVGFVYWLLAALKVMAFAGILRLADAVFDTHILTFTLLIAVATGLFFDLVPALHASQTRPAESLQTGERQHSSRSVRRWRGALLTVEMTLTLVLLVAATLVVRSVTRLNAINLGFQTESVVAAHVKLPPVPYPDATRHLTFFEELERRLAAHPKIAAVVFANNLPLRGGWGTGIEVEGRLQKRFGDFDSADA